MGFTFATTRQRSIRARLALLALLGPTALPTPGAAGAELDAGVITAENFETRQVGGPDADGGIGDWYLGNGTICAVVSDPAHESPLSPRGGVLIDLGHCGAHDDQWSVFQPLLNLSQSEVVPIESVEAGRDEERAWLRTRAHYHGVEILTTYGVERASPTSLSIAFRAKRLTEGDRLFGLGAIALHASGQLAAFSLSPGELTRSRGFVHPPNDRSSTRKLLASLTATDLTVLVGAEGWPPISYGLERVGAALETPGGRQPLVAFSITGGHYTLQNALASPPWIGGTDGTPGLLQLLQLPFMDLAQGSELALDYRIRVGERADVASVTDQVFADEPMIRGRVDDPAARVHLALASGAPVSQVAPDSRGEFALRLPPGRYRALARAPAGREAELDFEVAARPADGTASESAATALPLLALGSPGWVVLPRDFVGRLVFLARDGSGPVRFGASLLGFRVGEQAVPTGVEADFLNLATPAASPRRVALPPGRYRVVAVRGPEYAASETTLEVRAGEETPLALLPLARTAATPGWIAADLHVHTGQSFDSALPETLQLEAFAASGAEVLVSTEHDRIFDPRPAIAAAGLEGLLVGVVGSEMTSAYAGGDSPYTTGHLNAFPLEALPRAFRRGAIALEGRRLRDVLAELGQRARPPLVQLNHPRPDPRGDDVDAYFNHLAVAGEPLDPTKPLGAWPNSVLVEKSPIHGGRDLDVDAMELLNAENVLRFRRTRADWLAFLLQGERIVGTANSDSHRLGHLVGLPRTYVRLEDDRVTAFDEAAFLAALRAGRAYGSTGPLLDVRLGGAGIGELHADSKGVLEIAVSAADWIPIAEWRAYVNGELVHRAPIRRGEPAALPLVFARDSFVTVEVEGPAEGRYAEVLPDFVPIAFSNPIFVDADRDGRWEAPGLPERGALPATITHPDRPD